MNKKLCVIIGVGPGNGAAFARRFAKEGYFIALLARSQEYSTELANQIGNAKAYTCDVSSNESIEKTFTAIKEELGPIDTLIYNAGSGAWGTIEQISAKDFESNWRINTLGLMIASQRVIPDMKKNGQGNIIIIGATASKRGGINTAAFAPAKAAQKSLAESMSKHLAPMGIHVGLVIIDGIINLPHTRKQMPDKTDDFFMQPDNVAETVYWLTQQPRSTWTFEVEIRPFGEVW